MYKHLTKHTNSPKKEISYHNLIMGCNTSTVDQTIVLSGDYKCQKIMYINP